jgi:hypothetical protein
VLLRFACVCDGVACMHDASALRPRWTTYVNTVWMLYNSVGGYVACCIRCVGARVVCCLALRGGDASHTNYSLLQ